MGGEDAEKIIRIPGETLLIKLTPEEEVYRSKYLKDLKKLTDEKLVCSVCSVALAADVHKGKDLFIHRALCVLMCEACYNFYGDGCFSADEDGDDKYCRWCGQGGTLYLCSKCTCAFCQKCIQQNLKPSVFSDLENDDWQCYICNPRPLFGSRTICWGAQQLNKIGKDKEKDKVRKQKEKIEKLEEKRKEESLKKVSRKASVSEEDVSTKKRKSRARDSDSSPEVMPTKRPKRELKEAAETNGNISRSSRRKKDSSSDNESLDNLKKVSRRSRTTTKKHEKSAYSSSEDSDVSIKNKVNNKKKKTRASSEDSSKERKKSKRKSVKKKVDSSDDESSDEKQLRKKKLTKKKKKESSYSSSDEKKNKKKLRKKKKEATSEESSDDDKKKAKIGRKKKGESTDDDSDSDSGDKKTKRISKYKKESRKEPDSDIELTKKEKKNNEYVDVNSKGSVENALVKKRIKLAILWLSNTVKDIAELGDLISLRAKKFSKKKINAESLKSYDDVLKAVSKLKQLISGVHSNYNHIETSLDAHLKPWKILTGLEDPEIEKHPEGETNSGVDGNVPKEDDKQECNKNQPDTDVIIETNNLSDQVKKEVKVKEEKIETMQWSGLSGDSDSEREDTLKASISKANETLDKVDEEQRALELDVKVESKSSAADNEISKSSEANKADSSKSGNDMSTVHDSSLQVTNPHDNDNQESVDMFDDLESSKCEKEDKIRSDDESEKITNEMLTKSNETVVNSTPKKKKNEVTDESSENEKTLRTPNEDSLKSDDESGSELPEEKNASVRKPQIKKESPEEPKDETKDCARKDTPIKKKSRAALTVKNESTGQ